MKYKVKKIFFIKWLFILKREEWNSKNNLNLYNSSKQKII